MSVLALALPACGVDLPDGAEAEQPGPVSAPTASPDTTSPGTTSPVATSPDTESSETTPDSTSVGETDATSDAVVAEPATTDSSTTPSTTGSATDPIADAFGWEAIDPASPDQVEKGILEVPLDYDEPSGDVVELYVARHRATDPGNRIGVLLVNPGGPGAGGSVLAEFAAAIYDEILVERFDIIGWDPRGTGLSTPPIDCVDDYDPYFALDSNPESAEEEADFVAALDEFATGCDERSGDLLDHVNTVDAARDMDSIRAALGEDQITYFGWSYGTQLGATWATLFPETVRGAVLDGAVDPTTGRAQGLLDQAAGFESTFQTFLADCASKPTCPLGSGRDPGAEVIDLLARIETETIPTVEGRPDLTSGIAEFGIGNALYSEQSWPALAQALADAGNGDGAGLLAQYDDYMLRFEDGTYSNDLEAYYVITCADDPDTGGIVAAVDARATFRATAPLIGSTTAAELAICALLPDFPAPDFRITGAGAGPIMVVGNTGDPATPFEGSRNMAATLEDGFFITVQADSHTAYGLNDCIDTAIDGYLVELTIPPADTIC